MSEFDPAEFIENLNRSVAELDGLEKKAYIAGALLSVPPDQKRLVVTLIDLTKDIDDQVLVLIHGIRTAGTWQSKFKSLVETEVSNIEIIPIKYEFFDLVRFLIPVARRKPIRRITRQLRSARDRSMGGNISVIAHSFGTYVVSEILRKNSDIKVRRLITCGSIISPDFRWDMLPGNLRNDVVNEVGCKDVYPVIAKAATIGFGPSGTFGFGSVEVCDRFHDLKHDGFFTEDFMATYWLPLIKEDRIVASTYSQEDPPYYWSLLSLFSLSAWFYLSVVVAVVYFAWLR